MTLKKKYEGDLPSVTFYPPPSPHPSSCWCCPLMNHKRPGGLQGISPHIYTKWQCHCFSQLPHWKAINSPETGLRHTWNDFKFTLSILRIFFTRLILEQMRDTSWAQRFNQALLIFPWSLHSLNNQLFLKAANSLHWVNNNTSDFAIEPSASQ